MAMRNTLSNWITNAIYVSKGRRFTYNGRLWMPALFDTPAKRRIWKMSRQVGKSTGGAAEALARQCLHTSFNILYVAPEQDQAKKYSHDKIKPIIDESPIITNHIGKYNSVHDKEFITGGKLYLKWAKHNPDSCRGITADMIHYDEVQDQDLDILEPVINESLFTSEHRLRLYTGTPKSFSNPIHKRWLDSDQREWVVRCTHHTPNKWVRLGIKSIGKKGPVCHHCDNLLDVDDGLWVVHNPGGKIAGFHVHQLHCKISHRTEEDWQDIIEKYENYPEDKFLNEVLGESSDSAEVPINQTLLHNLCDPEMANSLEPNPKHMGGKTYAGIDWGHGQFSTALAIGTWESGRFRYLYFKVYEGTQTDPRFCIPDMIKILDRFNVQRVHADYGGGFGMNSRLDEELSKIGKNKMLTTNYWSNSAKSRDQKWDTNHLLPMLTMNKPRHLSDFINLMLKGRIILPKWSDFHPKYSEHFMNLRREVSFNERGKEDVHFLRVGLDDLFQAAVYCHIIARADKAS